MLPSPIDVVSSLQESVVDGSLFQDLGASFTRLLIGLSLAACHRSIAWDTACQIKNSG